MNILSTSNATVREAYSRLELQQTSQKNSKNASGNDSDSVSISQYLSYEQYTYSANLADSSNVSSNDAAGSADQSGGTAASDTISLLQIRNSYFDTIQSGIKSLFESLSGNNTNSSSSSSSSSFSDLYSTVSGAKVSSLGNTTESSDSSYYSADQTADRIAGFALSFYSGGDRAEYVAEVGEAVMKGYAQAIESMGGNVPDISRETISRVMDKLQQFASGTDVNTLA